MKHRAIIVGAGRMGSGWGLSEKSHYYVHAKTYMDLKDRVELVGFVEPNKDRAEWAREKWKVDIFPDVTSALRETKANVASVCTPPEMRREIFDQIDDYKRCPAVWCEKPFAVERWPWDITKIQYVQVNYCRRFDRFHQKVKHFMKDATDSRLIVMAKKDVHTVCHLTDLARWWGVEKFDYVDTPGEPGAYVLRYKIKDRLWLEQFFPSGGLAGDEFMKNALSNLLDAVEGKAELLSPPENAIASEKWANELLGVK